MTLLRTEIERALDELISNEEGMRFQGLAVVLAKQRWPELIATERKKDLGLDAYAQALLAQDGTGRGLACSLTATLEKVKSDVQKIKQFAPDVKVLLFATPHKVTTQTSMVWAKTIRSGHGIELVVISREDIITDLMLPGNASVCRSHLGIPVPVEPSLIDIVSRTQAAVSEVTGTWALHPRLAGRPRIPLTTMLLDQEGAETGEALGLEDLHAMLSEGRRIVLEAPAGRGKTTTLVQLAERHQDQGASSAGSWRVPPWPRRNRSCCRIC
jgi:thymidylate kinase